MINPQKVAQIKACRNVYSLSATARHFGVSKDTVHRIWHGKAHKAVQPSEAPYVNTARKSATQIREDAEWLLTQGVSIEEAAERIGVPASRIKREVGPALYVM